MVEGGFDDGRYAGHGYPTAGGLPGAGVPGAGFSGAAFPGAGFSGAGVPGAGPPSGPPGGPPAEWLHEGPHQPQPLPFGAPGPFPTGGQWAPPPPLDSDRVRHWSWPTAAPWVVAGLLCAVLLTGRGGQAAPAVPGEPPVEAPVDTEAAATTTPATVGAPCGQVAS